MISGSDVTAPLGTTKIHTASQKDLVVSLTAEAALLTDTKIIGKTDGSTSTSEDRASIKVWAELDPAINPSTGLPVPGTGKEAFPGKVALAERIQTLKGRLSGITFGADNLTWYNVPEEVQLILNTTNANGFNFLLLDVESGDHTIAVFATLSTEESGDQENTQKPVAAVGKRTVIVNEVRLIQEAATGQ